MSRPSSPTSRIVTIVTPTLSALESVVAPSPVANERRWRALIRHGLPVIGVVLVVMLIAVIAFYIYESNRRGAITLSNDLITAIDRRVSVQMHAYLSPAQQFLDLAGDVSGARGVFEGGAAAEKFALRALPNIGPVTAFSYADPDGNFLFVVKNSLGGYDTKTVDRRNGGHRVTWVRRDAQGKVIETGDDPTDTFDPRGRPWYKGAEAARRPFWTDTYLFFTVHKPGITLAVPRYDDKGKLKAVLGVDVELATLCTFLKRLDIGVSGRALVVDRNSRIVAYPSNDWLPADRPDVVAPQLDQMGDPVLTRVYNRLRVEGYGNKVIDVGNRRIIVSSEPVSLLTDREWVVLIVVPESDFVGFVASSGWVALAMSAVVVLIVAAMAALLAWRSLYAERRAAAAAARQQALETRTQAFTDLARLSTGTGGEIEESLHQATESAASACQAKRVAVWTSSADGRTLRCADCFDRTAGDHTSGLELHRDELPNLFAALAKGEPIDTGHAGHDRRTAELFALYLEPLEISDVYLAPITAAGRPIGMLSVEEPRRGDRGAGLAAFCDALASLFALRFAAAAAPAPAAIARGDAGPGPAASAPAAAEPPVVADSLAQRQTRLERTLLQNNAPVDGLGASWIDKAAVGIIKLPEWTSVAQRPLDGGLRTTMDTLVQEIRHVIEQSGISYAALLDDQIVLAAFSADSGTIAADAYAVAQAALDLRDRLLGLEEKWDLSLDYRLAIDIGPVMTSAVGTDPPSRNLWGGAVGIARVLAASAGRHSIAASETAYDLLSGDFLFRSRGSYFLPETGTMRTFVLVGRI